MTTKAPSKTEQARKIREENAAKKEAEKKEFPHSEEVQEAVEAEQNPQVTEAIQKEIARLMALGKVSADSYGRVLKGELTTKEAVERGPAKKEEKAEKNGKAGVKELSEVLDDLENPDLMFQGEEPCYYVWTRSMIAQKKNGAILFKMQENGQDPTQSASGWKKMPAGLTVTRGETTRETVKEVEKVVEKEVARVPEDAAIRQSIERQYRQTIEETQGAGVDTQPYIRAQNALKQLAEDLGLGLDFNELDNWVPPKKKKAAKKPKTETKVSSVKEEEK